MSVESPCVSICVVDPDSGYCMGCLRSLAEITCWLEYSDDEKRAVIRAIDERRTAAFVTDKYR